MDTYRGVSIGNVIECEGGSIIVPTYTTATAVDRDGKVIKEFTGRDVHMENFIQVVQSRKSADLFGPIGEGHVSSALCHLANASYRVGQAIPGEAMREVVKGHGVLEEAAGRMLELLRANNVDIGKTPLTKGQPLLVDTTTEMCTGPASGSANLHLTRKYRAPFTVPTVVAST
jgi:hypothetical protein